MCLDIDYFTYTILFVQNYTTSEHCNLIIVQALHPIFLSIESGYLGNIFHSHPCTSILPWVSELACEPVPIFTYGPLGQFHINLPPFFPKDI